MLSIKYKWYANIFYNERCMMLSDILGTFTLYSHTHSKTLHVLSYLSLKKCCFELVKNATNNNNCYYIVFYLHAHRYYVVSF